MEHWNKDKLDTSTADTGNMEEVPSTSLKELLDTMAREQISGFDKMDSNQKSGQRKLLKAQLNTRLAYLFPGSDGMHLSRKWIAHGPELQEYDFLFDQQTMATILANPSDGETKPEEAKDEGRKQISILVLLFAYIVSLYRQDSPQKITDDNRKKRTNEILELAQNIVKNGPSSKASENFIRKQWGRYSHLRIIQDMCLISLNCDFDEKIISIMASLLNVSPETISPIIEQNSKLVKIKEKIEKYVEAWTRKIEQAYIDAYDKLSDSMIFTEDKSACLLCNTEVELLRSLLKILPDAGQSIFKAIQKDQWEVISEEDRNLLISYIETLSTTPDILNRYIGAPDQFKYITQVEETIMKLKNPPYYRVRKKNATDCRHC